MKFVEPTLAGEWITLGVVEYVAGGPAGRRKVRSSVASAAEAGELVVRWIRHQGWTANGLLRHPVWDAAAGTIPAIPSTS